MLTFMFKSWEFWACLLEGAWDRLAHGPESVDFGQLSPDLPSKAAWGLVLLPGWVLVVVSLAMAAAYLNERLDLGLSVVSLVAAVGLFLLIGLGRSLVRVHLVVLALVARGRRVRARRKSKLNGR